MGRTHSCETRDLRTQSIVRIGPETAEGARGTLSRRRETRLIKQVCLSDDEDDDTADATHPIDGLRRKRKGKQSRKRDSRARERVFFRPITSAVPWITSLFASALFPGAPAHALDRCPERELRSRFAGDGESAGPH